MKKFYIITNICLAIMFICTAYYLVVEAIRLDSFVTVASSQNLWKEYSSAITNSSILLVLSAISLIASTFLLICFNYRFDGVSLREKIAARITESKEARAKYKAEKAEADKQAAIEDTQKKLEELQKELDEMKKN